VTSSTVAAVPVADRLAAVVDDQTTVLSAAPVTVSIAA